MALKSTNTFHCKTFHNLPKLGFLVWKYTIWQHCARPKMKPFNLCCLNFVPCDQILCRMTKFCVIQLNSVSYNWILCRAIKLCVVRLSYVSCDQILCCTTELCVVQLNYVSYNWIMCRTTELCVVQLNFVSRDQIMCRATKLCVVWPKFVSSDPKFVFCVNRPLMPFCSALFAFSACKGRPAKVQKLLEGKGPFLTTSSSPWWEQGCQMVCFQTKIPNLGKFWRVVQ
jgi:hypothetical protein